MKLKFKVSTWINGAGTFGAQINPVFNGEQLSATDHRPNGLKTRRLARKAALNIVRTLRTQRLHVIEVTKKDIREGIGRDCSNCPVANALYRQLPAMGFEDCYADVTPYACWADAPGIEIKRRRWGFSKGPIATLPPDRFPNDLIEWTMDFDDWYDSEGMTLREWRKRHGYRDGETPIKPHPFKFLLNLDDFDGFTPATIFDKRKFPVDARTEQR